MRGIRGSNSYDLADIDPVSVRIGEDEGAQSVVLVLKVPDNSQSMLLAGLQGRIRVRDKHMSLIECRGLVGLLQRQMKLRGVLFQDHEADGIAVLEDFFETEYGMINLQGAVDVGDPEGRGDAAEALAGGIV